LRFFNGCFIFLFVLMLAIPLVFVDLESDRISVTENRMLANRPLPSDIRNNPGKFVRQFDYWFKDSIGFRERLVGIYITVNENKWLNNVIRYNNGQSVYLVGEKGHHYFAGEDGLMISKFQGKKFPRDKILSSDIILSSDELLSLMAESLRDVKAYLENKGIPLVVMFCADKESVYPEFYPKSIKRGSEPIQLDIITNYLQENTNVDIFNIKQALVAEKDVYLLYNVSSGDLTHYNQIGAFFAYRELMKHITKYFPQIVPYETDDIEISYDEKEIPSVTLKSGFTYKRLDPSFFDNVNVDETFALGNHAYENMNSNSPVILFLCDSYAEEQFIGKYFAQQFSKAIFIHYSNAVGIQEFVNLFKPDIVVFESAERELGGFAECVFWILVLP
jgi:hypothetical protein